MGLIMNAIQSLRRLEKLMGPEARKTMRFCAILSLVATILLNMVPYSCGLLLEGLIHSVQEYGGFYVNSVLDQCTLVLLAVVLWFVATMHSKHKMINLALTTMRRIREALNSKMMAIPIRDIDKLPSGDLASRFTNDLPAVYRLIASDYTGFITHMTMIVAIILMMIVVSPVLAMVYIVIMPITLRIGKKITSESEEEFAAQREKVAELTTRMSDIITTHATIKTENMEKQVLEDFRDINGDFTEAFVRTHTRSGMIAPIVSIMANTGYLATVIFGAIMLYYGHLDIGMFMSFMIYVRLVNNPLTMSVKVYDGLRDEIISLDRIIEILDMPEEEETEKDEGFTIDDGTIEFKDVCFSYVPGQEILHSVSFTAESNQFIALVGPTASGKTTAANLMMGFYSPDSGSITIDGEDLHRIPHSELSRKMSAVLQNPWVFDGTIRENIVYNREGFSEEDFMEITKAVGLDDYVKGLPDGYDTQIGDDLRRLPLAQRRMLALSRALIGSPKIVILDEAVAGLDPITGQSIIERLKKSKLGRTIIIITHNPVLIEQADKVIRIEDGRVAGN